MGSEVGSRSSFGSGSSRFSVSKLTKYELKKRFYEKVDDFKNKVLLHKEQGIAVYRAKCAYSGAVVVLRGYAREELSPQARERVWNEVQTLQNLQCPFTTKCFDAFEDHGWWWLVMENSACGDLYSVISSTGALHEEGWFVSQVILPLLQTLAYLHKEGIIHRDVKPENIMFNSEKVTKLTGFFLCVDVSRVGYPKDLVGNIDYMAPEIFILNNGEGLFEEQIRAEYPDILTYDYKVDIWQLGCLTYEVLLGHPPFSADDPDQTVEAILLSEPDFPAFLSDGAVDFLKLTLNKLAADRPSAKELLSHPWVRQNLDWQAPIGFNDPIPNIDYSYYTRGSDILDSDDEGSNDDEWAQNQAKWYNPRSWFQRNNSEQDLSGANEGLSSANGGNGNRRPVAGADLIKPVGALSESNYGEGGWAGWLSRLISGQKPGGISVGGLVGGQRSSVETLSGPGLSLGNGNQVVPLNAKGGFSSASKFEQSVVPMHKVIDPIGGHPHQTRESDIWAEDISNNESQNGGMKDAFGSSRHSGGDNDDGGDTAEGRRLFAVLARGKIQSPRISMSHTDLRKDIDSIPDPRSVVEAHQPCRDAIIGTKSVVSSSGSFNGSGNGSGNAQQKVSLDAGNNFAPSSEVSAKAGSQPSVAPSPFQLRMTPSPTPPSFQPPVMGGGRPQPLSEVVVSTRPLS